MTDKALQGPKKEPEKRKIDIPKDFIKKIKNLGMKVEDAEVLFKSKIDWCAVYIENKIYCTEPGCDFSTTIDKEDLTNHMINVHEYGEHPCNHDHCNYVAASKVKFQSVGSFVLSYSETFGVPYKNAYKAIRKQFLVQVLETKLSIDF